MNQLEMNDPKNYTLKEGDYRITVRVWEASDLIPKEANGVANPRCIVQVGDQIKQTQKVKKTLTPLYDQSFNFEFQNLKKSELEFLKIIFIIQDVGIISNSHLGGYEIDVTSVYFNENHMFNKTWFTLFDFEGDMEGCIGYVKATIEVLGPGDEPTILESITDDPSAEKTIISPKIRPSGHLIMAEVYRAEFLSPVNLTTRSVDPIVRVKYGGIYKDTKKLKDTSNPEFNQIIFLSAVLPNHSKDIFIELIHSSFLTETLIGTAKVPFNLFKNSNNFKPVWLNIYGPPLSSYNEYSKQMALNGYKIGTTFRGRVLVRLSSRDEKNPQSEVIYMRYKLPQIIIPNPLQKVYVLRIDVFDGSVLPTKSKGILHFCIGPYMIKSSFKKMDQRQSIYWNESLHDRKLVFPVDINQIPDLIIYFCDEDAESRRITYQRIPAKDLVAYNTKSTRKVNQVRIIKFLEDKSHQLLQPDQFPGFAVVRTVLYAFSPTTKKDIVVVNSKNIIRKKYKLLLFTYIARDLASGNQNGTSNPQLIYKVGGQTSQTQVHLNTLNPNFYEIITMDIELDENQNSSPPTLMILMYHIVEKNNELTEKKVLLGRFWLLLKNNKKDKKIFIFDRNKKDDGRIYISYEKPQWIPLIYDQENRIDGQLLMGYVLCKDEDYDKSNLKFLNILPQFATETISMFPFGIRSILNQKNKEHSYEIRVNDVSDRVFLDTKEKKLTDNTTSRISIIKNQDDLKDSNLVYSSIEHQKNVAEGKPEQFPFQMQIRVPFLKELCPIMEIFVYENTITSSEKTLVGIGQYNMMKALGYFYREEEDKDYIDKWRGIFHLDKISKLNNTKDKNEKIKIQKIQPENQMIYFENLIYEIKVPLGINNKANKIKNQQQDDINKNQFEHIGQTYILKIPNYVLDDDIIQQYESKKNIFIQKNQFKEDKDMMVKSKQMNLQQIEIDEDKSIDLSASFSQKNEVLDDSRDTAQQQELYFKNEDNQQIEEIKRYQPDKKSQFSQRKKNEKETIEQYGISQKDLDEDQFLQQLSMTKNNEKQKNTNDFEKNLAAALTRRLTQLADDKMKTKLKRIFEQQLTMEMTTVDEENKKLTKYNNLKQIELDPRKDINLEEDSDMDDTVELSNFDFQNDEQIQILPGEISRKDLQYNDLFVEENQDAKDKRNQNELKKWMSKLRLKNPLAGFFKKKKKTIQYQEYDTDDDEEYDDVLPYLKGRKEYQDDLEDIIYLDKKKQAVEVCSIYGGTSRVKKNINLLKIWKINKKPKKFKMCNFKFLFFRQNRSDLIPKKKILSFLRSVQKTKPYKVRLYIMRGLQITSLIDKDQPKTYLKIFFNKELIEEDKDSEREGQYPEYYRFYEFPIQELPGTSNIRIEIIEKGILNQKNLLGFTEIDLEDRHFSVEWNSQEKKPVEKRNIVNPLYGSRGRLEMWLEILPQKNKEPPTIIYPKEQLPYELRVIIWKTKECVFADQMTKSNDLFGRGGVMRGTKFLETDTHWRCRNIGSFNWRWKFEIQLPVDENKNYGEDKFLMQLWDRDIIARNDLIGEIEISLNQHKMLQKSHSRKQAVEMRKRIAGTGEETNMLWFDVFHPEKLDDEGNKISQGKVLLSFECMPKEEAEKFENAQGRAEPNFYPTLPQPVGRFSFDLLSPCKTLKAIIGPDLYYKMCYTIWYILMMVILVFVGYYVFTTYLGIAISGFGQLIINLLYDDNIYEIFYKSINKQN